MKSLEPLKKIIFKHWLSLLVSLIGTVGVVYYLILYSSELIRLKQLSYFQIIILSVITIIIQFVSARFTLLLVQFFDVRMSIGSALSLNTSSAVINIIPFGAVGFRALYFKRVYGLRYLNYGLVMFCNLFFVYFVGGLMGLIGLLLISNKNISFIPLLFIFIVYILGSLAVLGFLIRLDRKRKIDETVIVKLPFPKKIIEIIASILDGFGLMGTHPQTIIALLENVLISQILVGVKIWLIGIWLSYPLQLGGGIILSSLSLVVSALPIPNGTLGLKEVVSGLGATALGITVVGGVIIAGVDRILSTGWNLFVGSICLFIIRKNISAVENGPDFSSTEQ